MKVYVDESGTLPDRKDKVIIVAAVGVWSLIQIKNIISSVRKKSRLKKKSGELKFYTSGDRTKKLFFEKVVKQRIGIFVVVVEKNGQSIPDTPENFAALCWFLLKDVDDFYINFKHVVFDKHFSRKSDILNFNSYVNNLIDRKISIEHIDSSKDLVVNIADMITGAVLSAETKKAKEYFEVIKPKLVSYKKISWKDLKRSYLNEKLA